MSLRLDHATVIDPAPGGPRVLDSATVLIEQGTITSIGAGRVEADHVIDAPGCIVTPGFVNAHTHAAMTLFRGYADDLPLEAWLHDRIWPAEARITPEAVRAGTQLAIAEMLAAGTTAFADMYLFEHAVAEAASQAGIRCLAGASVVDFDTPEGPGDRSIERAAGFLDDWTGRDALVQASIAPHATYTCSAETLQACAELAESHDVPLQTHCSETRHEVYRVEQETGRRPVAQLAENGCLTERSMLAHCGWITKDEVRAVARADATIVHNPTANMKLATGGYLPLPECIHEGVPVALGSDGPASNNTLDPFQEMKRAALLHDHHRWQAGAVPASQALAMATRIGAEALGIEGGGRLTEGAPADLCVIDATRPHMAPMHDPVSQVVYAARAGDVRATIVAGEVLYEEGSYATLDLEAVLADARAWAQRLTRSPE